MTMTCRALRPRRLVFVGVLLLGAVLQSAFAAQTAMDLYRQCRDKATTALQRQCFPAAIRQSEIELTAAEKLARANLEELEAISPGSRSVHPVRAFDEATRAFRTFREAEWRRVLTSYGSGTGGDLAASETVIRMNLERVDALTDEAAMR